MKAIVLEIICYTDTTDKWLHDKNEIRIYSTPSCSKKCDVE